MCIIVIYNHRYKPVEVFFYYYFYFSTLLGHWDFREYYVLKHEGSGISSSIFLFFRSTRTAKTRTTIIERNTRRRPPATTAPQYAPSLQGVDKSDVPQRCSWKNIKNKSVSLTAFCYVTSIMVPNNICFSKVFLLVDWRPVVLIDGHIFRMQFNGKKKLFSAERSYDSLYGIKIVWMWCFCIAFIVYASYAQYRRNTAFKNAR